MVCNFWWNFYGDGIVHITFSSAEDQDLLFGRSLHPPRTWWTLWERGLQHWWMPFGCKRAPGAVFSRILIEPLVLIRDCGFPKCKSWWQIGVLAAVHWKICRHLCHSRVEHHASYVSCAEPSGGRRATRIHGLGISRRVLRAVGFGCACPAWQFPREKTIDLWLEDFRSAETDLCCRILAWNEKIWSGKKQKSVIQFQPGSMQNNRLLHQGVPAIFAWQTVELMKMQIPSYQWEHEGPAFQVALTKITITVTIWIHQGFVCLFVCLLASKCWNSKASFINVRWENLEFQTRRNASQDFDSAFILSAIDEWYSNRDDFRDFVRGPLHDELVNLLPSPALPCAYVPLILSSAWAFVFDIGLSLHKSGTDTQSLCIFLFPYLSFTSWYWATFNGVFYLSGKTARLFRGSLLMDWAKTLCVAGGIAMFNFVGFAWLQAVTRTTNLLQISLFVLCSLLIPCFILHVFEICKRRDQPSFSWQIWGCFRSEVLRGNNFENTMAQHAVVWNLLCL